MEQIKTISIDDKNYPQALKKIPGAPKKLYFKGQLKPEPARNASPARKAAPACNFVRSTTGRLSAAGGCSDAGGENCIAVVGTRRCSSYGKAIAFNIAGDLAEAGLTIVSGLAPGIDTAAHQAVVEKGKRTIAVLGTGLDEKTLYPKENIKLAGKIVAAGGCLISEYPPGTAGSTFTFPQRNRLISGLSLATLVVEAKKKSGALITANWAKSQGRLVFAVPGSVYSSNSQGCHYLIKRGARLVENANDILQSLKLPCLTSGVKQLGGENEEENLILGALEEGELYIDKIMEKTKLTIQQVSSALSNLEIQGKVRNLGGNVYTLAC